MTPEQKARVSIDTLLVAAGWHVCNVSDANIHASCGVAIREFPLNTGFGFADYLRTRTNALRQVNQGAAQPNLNTKIIKAMVVPLPPIAEQTRILAEVDRHLSIIQEVEAEVDANLQRAQALRQATLAKAFA